jgi:hypothetical protein
LKPSPEGEGWDEGIRIATYWDWYNCLTGLLQSHEKSHAKAFSLISNLLPISLNGLSRLDL